MRRRFRQLLDWLHWPELKREPPPRAAIAIVIVGLLACAVAAYATTIENASEAAHLEWVQETPIPDSEPAKVPGGEQKMKLTDGLIRATGTNVSGYSLYQVATILQIEKDAPIEESTVICAIAAPHGTEIGQSYYGLRALYPRSSEDGIYKQLREERLSIDFSSHGHSYAILEVGDLPIRFTSEKGVKLEWPQYEKGTEHLDYSIAGKPKGTLRLAFNSVWKTTDVPKAKISCTLKSSAGKSTVTTEAALKKVSPPIDEEAEEANREVLEEEEGPEDEEAGGETE